MNDSARARLVSTIFAGTAPSYDEIAAAASLGEDRRWKEALLSHLDAPGRVLDLACGTGILSFMIRDRFPGAEVVGLDVSAAHLDAARDRARLRRDGGVRFVLGAAESVALPGQFEAVTSCYLPKYADLPLLVSRVAECLSSGGLVAMQDFTYPEHPVVQKAWERHFDRLQELARDKWPEAIRMFDLLPDVIRKSTWVNDLVRLLLAQGFEGVEVKRLTWGAAAMVLGRRPCR